MRTRQGRNPYTLPLIGAIFNLICQVAWFLLMLRAVADDDWTQAIFWLLLLVFVGDHTTAAKSRSVHVHDPRGNDQ